MKKTILAALVAASFLLMGFEAPYDQQLTLGTNVVATANTNTVQGTATQLNYSAGVARLWVYLEGGTDATTTDGVVYHFSPAFVTRTGTNTVTTNVQHWTDTTIKLTVTPQGDTGIWASDWFEFGGIDYIVPTAIVNTSGGTITNGVSGDGKAWITWHQRR